MASDTAKAAPSLNNNPASEWTVEEVAVIRKALDLNKESRGSKKIE